MKTTFLSKNLIIYFLVLVISNNQIKAQSNSEEEDSQNLKETILKYDSLFWKAYNNCDIDQLRTFFTDDLEFYHDKSGLTKTLESFIESIENGICNSDDWHLRREAVEGTVNVFPVNNYGALISGEHVFYVKEKGKAERPEGKAKFMHLWQFKDNTWKMSRVYSYDHQPIPYLQDKTAILLSEGILLQYVGEYKSPQAGLATITREAEHLFLKSGAFQAAIYPESDDTFFIKGGNIQFKFIKGGNGKVVKMVILQDGATVDEAKRVE